MAGQEERQGGFFLCPTYLVLLLGKGGHHSRGYIPGLGILLLLRVQILDLGDTTCHLLWVEMCLPDRHVEVLISPVSLPQSVTLFETRSVVQV